MDPQRFDTLAKALSTPGSRRRLFSLLAALPLSRGLVTLLEPESVQGRSRKGRDGRNGRDDRSRGRKGNSNSSSSSGCIPESEATTCAGKCGTIRNNCLLSVECGACGCEPACEECATCVAGGCVEDQALAGTCCGGGTGVCAGGACIPCDAATPDCMGGECVCQLTASQCASGAVDAATCTCCTTGTCGSLTCPHNAAVACGSGVSCGSGSVSCYCHNLGSSTVCGSRTGCTTCTPGDQCTYNVIDGVRTYGTCISCNGCTSCFQECTV